MTIVYHSFFKLNLLKSLLSVCCLSSCFVLPTPHSLQYDDKRFNELANRIIMQNTVYEMDDFTRSNKRINGINISLTKDIDTNNILLSNTFFVDDIIDSLKIDRKLVDELREKLEDTGLRSFYKSNDSILFEVDGFLDDSWGYFYSAKKLNNDSSQFQFGYSSVHYVENVNEHWKKCASH